MKVILKHGFAYKTSYMIDLCGHFLCTRCACEFTVPKEECHLEMDVHNDMFYSCDCPECGNVCFADANKEGE